MEPAGLTDLPIEVIQHINNYLSVQDVMSCSLTCHYLRAVLNHNCVWRKYLPEGISGLATQEQQVSPSFQMGEGLSPLCEKRQLFARKTHLVKNWREGKFVQYSSSSEYEFKGVWLDLFGESDSLGSSIYKLKYIFLDHFVYDSAENGGIQIWDITKDQFFYTFSKMKNLIGYDARVMCRIAGSRLIIMECVRVFVYQIKLPEKDLPLLYSFLITDNIVTFNEIVHHGSHSNHCDETYHHVVNNYLMSTLPESNRLHVWDMNNASKIGSFELPIYASRILFVSFFGNIFMFELYTQAESPIYLVTFNLDNKQFSKNTLTYDEENTETVYYTFHVILVQNSKEPNSAGLYDIIFTLYDCNTFLELSQTRFTLQYCNVFSSQCFVDGKFIIDCLDRFHVVNALTLEICHTVRHCYDFNNIDNYTTYFNVYQNVIAVAVLLNHSMIQLRHVSRKDTLVIDLNGGLHPISDLYIDCSRMFMDSLVSVLS